MEQNKKISSEERMNQFALLEGEENVSLRGESIKQFDMGGGRYQAVMYPEAVHYRESDNAAWEEIDNNLEAATDVFGRSILKNKNNALHVELAEAADDGDLVTLKNGDATLSWQFEKTVNRVSPSVKSGQQRKLEKLAAQLGKSVSTLSTTETLESAQEKRLDYTEKTAQARYDELLPGLSVRYTLIGGKLKEDIILSNKAALENAALILKGNMDCLLNEDQTITIRHKGANKPSFVIDAPVAYDANGEDVPVSPVLQKVKGKTRLSYTIPEADLDAATYPITIDPVVHTTNAETNVLDLTLTQGETVSATGNGTGASYLKVGVSSSKESVALIRFLKLAKLKSSDTIISAVLRMAPKSGSSAKFTAAHEVLRAWQPKQINYDTFGVDDATKVCPDELDYSDSATSAYMLFDLTDIYRKWYESDGAGGDKNYGVLLRKAKRVSGAQYQEIYSSEASTSSYKPVFYVNYISHAGLEGWWQYESQSAGRAGTVNTDLFNGNVVLQHQDTEMNGNLCPVSITHTYNSCLSGTPASGTTDILRCGHGWRHSGLQRVYTKTLNSTDYYVWVDGDETEHWFKDKGNGAESKDLEGMQLKLTRYAATSSRPARIEIVDKQHTKMTFQKRPTLSTTGTWVDYWLLSVTDAHGNSASYT
ncbi:MAG: DNRLRE domain-containing protein, partial [Clostridia bacterium]|nr:DNRLRE domain-containing protein [Clostridia bacterium]